jgi:hypothetical protein
MPKKDSIYNCEGFKALVNHIAKVYDRHGFKLEGKCGCENKWSDAQMKKIRKMCIAHQKKNKSYVPKDERLYTEGVVCLHLKNKKKKDAGVILTIEAYMDETETFANYLWEKRNSRKFNEEGNVNISFGIAGSFTYGIDEGKPILDFDCAPKNGNFESKRKFIGGGQDTWLKRLRVPENAVVMSNHELLEVKEMII